MHKIDVIDNKAEEITQSFLRSQMGLRNVVDDYINNFVMVGQSHLGAKSQLKNEFFRLNALIQSLLTDGIYDVSQMINQEVIIESGKTTGILSKLETQLTKALRAQFFVFSEKLDKAHVYLGNKGSGESNKTAVKSLLTLYADTLTIDARGRKVDTERYVFLLVRKALIDIYNNLVIHNAYYNNPEAKVLVSNKDPEHRNHGKRVTMDSFECDSKQIFHPNTASLLEEV